MDYNEYEENDDDNNIDNDEEWEEIDPSEYTCQVYELISDIVRIESGQDKNGKQYCICIPFLVSPINRYIYFKKYNHDYSLFLTLINEGQTLEKASDILFHTRISPFMYDYILKDDNGEVIEDLSELEDLEDDMYPDITQPYWHINIKE